MSKVLIGVPCGSGIVKSSLLSSMLSLVMSTAGQINLAVIDGCLVHDSRNRFARGALEDQFTHLFMVDSDIDFPPDTLTRLLARDKDVVGCAYHYRRLPLESTVKTWGKDMNAAFMDELPEDLFKCHSLGTGCILIKTAVFARMKAPWFNFEYTESGDLAKTEDTVFCEQARYAGFDIWCDPTIKIKHIGDYGY